MLSWLDFLVNRQAIEAIQEKIDRDETETKAYRDSVSQKLADINKALADINKKLDDGN